MIKPYFVYVLRSQRDKRLYTGMTSDCQRRLREHNVGKVPSTRYRRPLILIYTEQFPSRSEAAVRERFLKSGPGHQFLKATLADQTSAPTTSG